MLPLTVPQGLEDRMFHGFLASHFAQPPEKAVKVSL